MITPEQCRAARALLDWSQDKLAGTSRVSAATIRQFEKGQRETTPSNIDALEAALLEGGVIFLEQQPSAGAGVCLAAPKNAFDSVVTICEIPFGGGWQAEATGVYELSVKGETEAEVTNECKKQLQMLCHHRGKKTVMLLFYYRLTPSSEQIITYVPKLITDEDGNRSGGVMEVEWR